MRRFNILGPDGRYLCPVCGFPGCFTGTSYDENRGLVGTGICPCCRWEPGFDGEPMANAGAGPSIEDSVRSYRRSWTAALLPWRGDPSSMPEGWDRHAQLKQLLETAPFLR